MSVLLPLFFAARSAAAAPAGFAGDWTTTFGDMTLIESSGVVRGTYQQDGFLCELEGRIEKGVLNFVYKEDGASGDGRFRLSADQDSFKGEWRRSGGKAWNPWLGSRRKPVVEARGFEGLWDTNFGRLRLKKSADGYAGVYAYADGALTGSEKGGLLKFRYRDAKSGEGEFSLSADGRALRGRCRADGAAAWEDWGGARVEPVPGRRWLVVVESRWEGSLAEQEYSYGEMLKTFFARTPRVQVRQRFFTDKSSLAKWMREASFLAEPTVIYLSSHGTDKGLITDSGDAGAAELAAALKGAENVSLVHFGACEVMKGGVPSEFFRLLGADARFPVSGFAEAVDWAASAVVDFMYLDLILSRDLPPARAAEELRRLMPFAAARSADSNYDGVSFRLLAPPGAAR
jgi:hypothetical protein